MITYVISHQQGQFNVNVIPGNGSYLISITTPTGEQSNVNLACAEKNNVDEYDLCREWASSNLSGEFVLSQLG